MFVDMWYGDKISDVESIDIYFNDLSSQYAGNCYIKGKVVGDYNTYDSLEIEETFPQLNINWD